MKLYVKIGTFENIFPIPGCKFQAVFSIEAGTSKILPAAHMYHLHIGSFPPGGDHSILIALKSDNLNNKLSDCSRLSM